ncbi:Protein Wnt-2 [Gryllus bimaculatus]|nr:Protein Wnt-2 [Gryllus bimaculatus]
MILLSELVRALGAGVLCARIPGLSPRQRELCRASPDAVAAVGEGMRLGLAECQHQFRGRRWNCSAVGADTVFGHVVVIGSREAAFTYAATAAGVAWALAAACARGNVSSCGCDTRPQRGRPRPAPPAASFKWGGCSADVQFAAAFTRRFLDARELEGDARSLMNLHNNRAGRRVFFSLGGGEGEPADGVQVPRRVRLVHHAHLLARPAALPPGGGPADLRRMRAPRRAVAAARRPRVGGGGAGGGVHRLALLGRGAAARAPRRSELVFLQESPNYCERDVAAGSLGTVGRACNRTIRGPGGCDLLCCGRGYNTHQLSRAWQCRCKFHWCCRVTCDTCHERVEQYTCK